MSVRTLIVDDSAAMQAMIRRKLSIDPAIEIVGTASSAEEARAQIKALNPDVVTLDVEMPGMNGLEFLERLMRLRPTPVVMLSSLTSEGAEISLAALEFGAFDCFDKALLRAPPMRCRPGNLPRSCAPLLARTRKVRRGGLQKRPCAPLGIMCPAPGA